VSGACTKANCPEGYGGTEVIYTVEYGKYTSDTSQEDANMKADSDLTANCQQHANKNGECLPLYYSAERSEEFCRNNCPQGYEGSCVTYTVEAGKYTSAVSQEHADAQAEADLLASGQEYANSNGQCLMLYYNMPLSGACTRNDCPEWHEGSTVSFSVPFAMFTSTVSQEDADAKAQEYFDEQCQLNANENGECTEIRIGNDAQCGSATKEHCPQYHYGTTVQMCVNANTYFAHTKEEANRMAIDHLEASKQQYANENGQCLPDDTPDWVDDGNEKCASGINDPDGSGYNAYARQTDRNPFSATYNQTRWYRIGNCPEPPPIDPDNPNPPIPPFPPSSGCSIPPFNPPADYTGWGFTGQCECAFHSETGGKIAEEAYWVDGEITYQRRWTEVGSCCCTYYRANDVISSNIYHTHFIPELTAVSGAAVELEHEYAYHYNVKISGYDQTTEPTVFEYGLPNMTNRFQLTEPNDFMASTDGISVEIAGPHKLRITIPAGLNLPSYKLLGMYLQDMTCPLTPEQGGGYNSCFSLGIAFTLIKE
jgi:hypothetical protein